MSIARQVMGCVSLTSLCPASISCAANGTQWLHEWDVDVPAGRPVILEHLTMRDWKTSEPLAIYNLGDYKKKWGNVSWS